jgi:hypothetical protein
MSTPIGRSICSWDMLLSGSQFHLQVIFVLGKRFKFSFSKQPLFLQCTSPNPSSGPCRRNWLSQESDCRWLNKSRRFDGLHTPPRVLQHTTRELSPSRCLRLPSMHPCKTELWKDRVSPSTNKDTVVPVTNHFAFPTKSRIPGLGVFTSPTVALRHCQHILSHLTSILTLFVVLVELGDMIHQSLHEFA